MSATEPDYSAAAWRQAAANKQRDSEPLQLPSGMRVRVRRPDISLWLVHGKMPDAFQRLILAQSSDEPAAALTTEDIIELGRFTVALVTSAVIEPRIVRGAPQAGEIGYAEIPEDDITFIVSWVQRLPEVADLTPFRSGPAVAATGNHSDAVRPAAEQHAGAPAEPGGGAGLRRRGRRSATPA